ncbi:MAG: 1,4-alpha-glucan branching protein GlgB [Candidatus Omnitrophota bacterium]|nr:1,4-alpha-glucan branching protein GlgB [Candidatus Omnitrophota bacterium]MBU1928270.1 1,4-alpha-glucan branching protein GlgB [Candidatus Omnitrophota bacterium]MBU2035416.1 1,4-alpha-glucan branching protein GlgB [Candidatus Omnitrophota bacterium]MBU2221420.1 1,4-alpha-glucan branching protein GlgB [Candidatus Omnitrophota bacterium]MBU2258962.1 1,4-alpha-glucan branching protein GlgB [Candidatus Omnitrophota bacterium]
MATENVKHGISFFSDEDIYLFREGNHFRLYEKMGSHIISDTDRSGTYFATWAPNAKEVSVIGDFNGWDIRAHPLAPRWDESGVWEGFVPGVGKGSLYKYHILSNINNFQTEKRDPFAFFSEIPPKTASVVWDLDYTWNDGQWMRDRHKNNSLESPISVYEIHLGSWRRMREENNRFFTYSELAEALIPYLKDMNYTHVELLPVMEHPFYGSWGYQTLGYFAPTSRYGTPQDFLFFMDRLHENGIGVILDWVPSHFPCDGHGLAYFDGSHLYEHADPRKGFHPDWKSYIFNYGRNETRSFLISSALFWMDKYHADGLRVDGVASMLYLDYSRQEGEWIPNEYGGRENIEAVNFIKRLNLEVYKNYPDTQMIAEESTAWPMVSKPIYTGGLGFGMKWNMGWMHDVLDYFAKDPVYRKYHHNQLTFSLLYAFTENFILSLSHDEVVHGKGSLLGKMPGDDWQKFANLRLLYGYMYGHPGKKLLFMGQEFAQRSEWNHDESLEWQLLGYPDHERLQRWLKELNYLYKTEPALYENDFNANGFEWMDCIDWERGIISFMRKSKTAASPVLVVCNFTPVPRTNYKIGIPMGGYWREALNSDAKEYGGSGYGNLGGIEAAPLPSHGKYYSLSLTVPPLATLFFKHDRPR